MTATSNAQNTPSPIALARPENHGRIERYATVYMERRPEAVVDGVADLDDARHWMATHGDGRTNVARTGE
jgi:hypothetical protein